MCAATQASRSHSCFNKRLAAAKWVYLIPAHLDSPERGQERLLKNTAVNRAAHRSATGEEALKLHY
jgi:hypothetical protein